MSDLQTKLADIVAAKDRLVRAMPRNPDVLALIAAVDALVKAASAGTDAAAPAAAKPATRPTRFKKKTT